MANYSLIATSKFEPFSFERYIKPYQLYGEEYKRQEDKLDTLLTNTAKLQAMLSEQDDKESYEKYKTYFDSLVDQANSLSGNGLLYNTRANINQLRAAYNSAILPIEAGYKKREEWKAAQQKLDIASGGKYRFDNDARIMSVDDFVKNPNLSYTGINGAAIQKDVEDQVKVIANSFLHDPEFIETAGGRYLMSRVQQGFSLKEALLAAAGDESAPEELKAIYNNVIDKYSGNPAWDRNWAEPYMQSGFMQGVKGYNQTFTANPDYENKNGIDYKLKEAQFDTIYELGDDGKYHLLNSLFAPTDKPDIVKGTGKDKNYYRIDEKGERIAVISNKVAEKEIEEYKKTKGKDPVLTSDQLPPNTSAGVDTENNPVYMIDFTTNKSGAESGKFWEILPFGRSVIKNFDNSPRHRTSWTDKGFSETDVGGGSGLVTFKDLMEDQDQFNKIDGNNMKKIDAHLKSLGLTMKNVLMFRDRDYFSNNHYRMVVIPPDLDLDKLMAQYKELGKYALSFADVFTTKWDSNTSKWYPVVKDEYKKDQLTDNKGSKKGEGTKDEHIEDNEEDDETTFIEDD